MTIEEINCSLKAQTAKHQAEVNRFERLEQFKGIRANERNNIIIKILSTIPEFAEDINGKPMISIQDLTEMLEKFRRGEY